MNIFASGEGSDPVRDRAVGWVCFSGARQQFDVRFRRETVLLVPKLSHLPSECLLE
jgi:hypothetical protein